MTDPLTLLLADARLPVAGHTQSAQLEAALAQGLTDVPAYLRLRLATVTRVEAGTAVAALGSLLSAPGPDGLVAVCEAWAARTPSLALRQNAVTMGRALFRLASRLWPLPELPEDAPRPVVLAAVAAVGGVPPRSLARVIGYDDVQTVTSAALKLAPLDPAVATSWVVDAFPAIEQLAEAVAGIRRPEEIPASSAPAIEQYAETHAVTTRRLFSA